MHLSQRVLEFLHFAFYYHFYFNLFLLFQRKVFLHVVLLLIYIFLLVDLISKLYSLYTLFGMCFVTGIYILLVDCYSLSIYTHKSIIYIFLHVSVTTSRALPRRDSLLLDA